MSDVITFSQELVRVHGHVDDCECQDCWLLKENGVFSTPGMVLDNLAQQHRIEKQIAKK